MPHRLFIPHPKKRSPILSITSLAIVNLVLLLVLLLQNVSLGTNGLKILGFATDININELYKKTNEERVKNGLKPLNYSSTLESAAYQKAQDMFKDNYWAHIAPDGTTPWDFIRSVGYEYTYAGENLAKDFNKSSSVVKAWMESPTHRENMLNPNYTEIGFAVVNGVLNGEKTTLIVQMFGKPVNANISSKKTENSKSLEQESEELLNKNVLSNASKSKESSEVEKEFSTLNINPINLQKNEEFLITVNTSLALNFVYFLLGFFLISLVVDGFLAFKMKHFRLTGNTLSHLVLFLGTLLLLIYLNNPSIL